ncbi:MAG: BACON domain-containing protein, partial [Bacteroidota bacterium]
MLFNEPVMDLHTGQPNLIELIPGSTSVSNSGPHLWRVWIDIDLDGAFHPVEELIHEELTTGYSSFEYNPSEDLDPLSTRMRIALSTEGFRDPCQVEGNADVEDYMVNLIPFTNTTLTFAPDTLFLPPNTGESSFDIFSNTDWTVSTQADWLMLGTTNGNGDATVGVSHTENTGLTNRETTIQIASSELLPQSLVVIQFGNVPFLEVSPTEFSFSSEAQVDSISVTSNISWSVTTLDDWVNISTSGGNDSGTVHFDITANTSTEARAAVIVFTAPELPSRTVIINQTGIPPILEISPTAINIGPLPGSEQFSIVSNTNWTLSTDASWIDLAFNSGSNNATVDFSFTENFSSDFRVDSIAVTALGLPPLYLVITQAGQEATLQVDPLLINLEAPAGNTSFQIIANTDWTVSTEAFWISLGTDSGTGNSEVGFAHTENVEPGSRTATIEVSAPGLPTQVITVIQASSQGILVVDTDTLFLPNSVGNATVNVTSNLDWSANSAAGWLGFIPENGSGNGTVTVMHAANSNLESRSTDIQFLADGAFPANVHVIQEGRPRFIDASTDTIFMNEAGGLAVFTIFSNVSWTAESSAGWLALAQTAGDGTVFIDLNVAPNGSPSERIATLDIQGEGTPPLTVVVVQEGDAPFLDLGTSSLLLSPSTADAEVQVLSNVNWTVTNSNDWLTPVNTSGTGDFALTLIHTANNAFTNRRDTLRFSAPGLPDVLLPVLQLGQTPDVPWVISPTSENHTIIIPPDFTGAISEQVSLEAGDAVGFFFTRPDGGLQSSNFFIYRPGET